MHAASHTTTGEGVTRRTPARRGYVPESIPAPWGIWRMTTPGVVSKLPLRGCSHPSGSTDGTAIGIAGRQPGRRRRYRRSVRIRRDSRMPYASDTTGERIGRRIAQARKARGLTQFQLAQCIPCSKSLIAQVERGHKPATLSLTTGAARALGVRLEQLTGQPYEDPQRGRVQATIPDIATPRAVRVHRREVADDRPCCRRSASRHAATRSTWPWQSGVTCAWFWGWRSSRRHGAGVHSPCRAARVHRAGGRAGGLTPHVQRKHLLSAPTRAVATAAPRGPHPSTTSPHRRMPRRPPGQLLEP